MPPPVRARQRGAATLMVVMVLFFVMSLVAAYASRNVIFEQRTATNQFEATASLEAAEAGLQWALGLVNAARIDDDCAISTDTSKPTFRQRYLTQDGVNGLITVPAAVRNGPLWPVCWYDEGNNRWVCRCPSDPASPGSPATSPTASYTPSFRVRFVQLNDGGTPNMPGMVRIEVVGCTRYDNTCLTFPAPHATLCRGTLCAHLALYPGLKSPPTAAFTVREKINVNAALDITNAEQGATGVAIMAGDSVDDKALFSLKGPPGMPAKDMVLENDPELGAGAFTADRLFASVFGVWPTTFRQQPAAVIIDCSATCDSSSIRDVVNLNPGRVFIADGDVTLNGGTLAAGTSLGTPTAPIALVVNGQFALTGGAEVYGLVYVNTSTWSTTAGTGLIQGALVAQRRVEGSGNFRVIRSKAVLEALRWTSGSFVVPPGGWRDFP